MISSNSSGLLKETLNTFKSGKRKFKAFYLKLKVLKSGLAVIQSIRLSTLITLAVHKCKDLMFSLFKNHLIRAIRVNLYVLNPFFLSFLPKRTEYLCTEAV